MSEFAKKEVEVEVKTVVETTSSSNTRTIHVPIDNNLVNYGALSKNVEGYDEEKRFYMSTGIFFVHLISICIYLF